MSISWRNSFAKASACCRTPRRTSLWCKRSACKWCSVLEPHVGDAASVAAEVIEADEPIEVFERGGTHRVGFRQPQVDDDAAGGGLPRGGPTPNSTATPRRTKK